MLVGSSPYPQTHPSIPSHGFSGNAIRWTCILRLAGGDELRDGSVSPREHGSWGMHKTTYQGCRDGAGKPGEAILLKTS